MKRNGMKQMHNKLPLYILIMLLLLASCKMGPAYKSPEVIAPEVFLYQTSPSDSLTDIKWWELFNDPVLDSLLRMALDSNREVKATFNSIEQARLKYKIQKANLYPDLNLQGQLNYGTYSGFLNDEAMGNYLAAGAVSWEIDFWGKLRRLNEAALADYLGTEFGYQNLRLSLVSQICLYYFQLRIYEESVAISRRTLALRDSSLNLIRARYDKGIVAEIDVNHAEIQQAIAASAVPLFERAAAQTQNALNVLIGNNPMEVARSIHIDSLVVNQDVPLGLPSELLLRRPDLALAEQKIVAQNARIGVAQANRFPSISLTALGGVSNELASFNTAGAAWSAGLNLFGPLFNWGKNKRQVEIEKLRTESAYLNYENAVFNAFREVEDALIAIQTFKEEYAARVNHVRAANNAQFLSSQRYDKGITSYLEYLESQRQAFEAELALVAVQGELLSSYVLLYKALGGGWLTEEDYQASQATN
ncbi:efflux transporter outer membrane subunit [Reichenbachiella ulvae]|uniref:Efflux transporter outer membrane subunit n=1 Tax=Reichenbachiella ulvae TaxID=2980104 RepID=A0ABT3CQ17_9BACT|nr:efflux transporter outer membrane subunit [Reichenbachiella ulvae]MCV9385791.1 efflux transporter outer membrane subunit [Reichenbachiella ulvae]